MTRVYLSIGSNINRERNIKSSINELRKVFGPLSLSSVYQSEAVGFTGSDFYNLAAGFDTGSSLKDVQHCLRRIERAHGRQRSARKYSSRPLDIDLLLFGDIIKHTKHVDVPRSEIELYAFVLLPLSEIAADVRHPETTQTIGKMWADFDAADQSIHKIEFEF